MDGPDSDAETFRIKRAIEELQRIEAELEEQYKSLQSEGKALEQKIDEESTKRMKLTYKKDSLKDSFDIAKFKVEKKLAEEEKLQEENELLRKEIEAEEKLSAEIVKDDEADVKKYSVEMEAITKDYVDAFELYQENNLPVVVGGMRNEVEPKMEMARTARKELDKVNNEIESEVQNVRPAYEMDIPLEQRRFVSKLFKDEQSAAKQAEDLMEQQVQQMKSKLEQLELGAQ